MDRKVIKRKVKPAKYTKKYNAPMKKKRKSIYDPEEEAKLEKLVFGDPNVINNLQDEDEKVHLKIGDRSDSENENEGEEKGKKAAWVDDDDVDYSIKKALDEQNRRLPGQRPEKTYTELLKNKFTAIVGTPKWAQLGKKEIDSDADSEDEILKHSNHIAVPKSKKLPKSTIEIKVLKDINHETHVEGPVITSVQFHPTSTVALVAGTSGILSLFAVNGKENNKLHNLKFERFPISCAKFLKEGTQIICGSLSYDYCHSYDLLSGATRKIPLPHEISNMKNFEVSPDGKLIAISGRFGEIHMLSSTTMELLYTFKMNRKCNSLSFTPDSKKLISHGESPDIYVWDLQSRSCLQRVVDEGCISNRSLAVSPNGQFLATGSKQGVVNIYDAKQVYENKAPTPLKVIMNLVTSITSLKFNPTSEILAMGSSKKYNAFKMVHLPSFSVFQNFPTANTVMHMPTNIDFSPGSGFMSVTNNRGSAYLYKLKHYGNY